MTRETGIGLLVIVTPSGGAPLRFMVDAEQATVGSGAHCEVRLGPELLAREELRLAAGVGVVTFEACSGERRVLQRGVPAARGRLGPDETLRIGSLSLSASAVSLSPAKKRVPLELLALVPAALALALALAYAPAPPSPQRPPPAPSLFVDAPVACPTADPFDAGLAARESGVTAEAKRERGPFSARDSVEAVRYFRLAAACYRVANAAAAAADASASAAALEGKVNDEYLTRRTRLEHAFLEKDVDGVDRELPVLTAMTAHLEGPYVDWLRREQRRAEAGKTKSRSSLL